MNGLPEKAVFGGGTRECASVFYESKVRMQGMSEELVLRLMQLHSSAQQNEAYSYATIGSGANAEFCCSGAGVAKQRSGAFAFMVCAAALSAAWPFLLHIRSAYSFVSAGFRAGDACSIMTDSRQGNPAERKKR